MMNSKTGRASGIGALRIAALATVATSAFTLPGFENEAHAQAIAPVADVCTGLSLNESQLTNLLGAVNNRSSRRSRAPLTGCWTFLPWSTVRCLW